MNPWIASAIAAMGGLLLGAYVGLPGAETPPPPATQQTDAARHIILGGGWITGVYYGAAGSVCQHMKDAGSFDDVKCAVEPSHGSIENLKSLRSGRTSFAIAQSDWHFHAYYGTSIFEDAKPFKTMRSVMALHGEPVTLLVRKQSRFRTLGDLKGARINVGEPGSGPHATWDVLAKRLDWSEADLAQLSEKSSIEAIAAMCRDEVDALFWLVGHPSAVVLDVIRDCDARLVSVTGPGIDGLVADNPYFRKTSIPANSYPGQSEAVTSFGVGATLVTRADVDEKLVYGMVSAVLSELDSFRGIHPALRTLTPEQMAADGLTAPLHPGALRAYKEKGVIQ